MKAKRQSGKLLADKINTSTTPNMDVPFPLGLMVFLLLCLAGRGNGSLAVGTVLLGCLDLPFFLSLEHTV